MTKRLIYFIFILTIFASCRQNKDLVYLQNIDPLLTNIQAKEREYKIQANDILYIQVLSLNKEIVDVFNTNMSTSQVSQYYNESTMYFQGFSVSDSGFVRIPVIGKVLVKGVSVREAELLIQSKADEYIKDATVIVKLANFKVTVIGEVKSPGIYYLYNNQVNILEVLGKAGDLTDYGNRKNVLVVRHAKDVTKTFRIDLTDKNIVLSDSYYLLPNDIIYVEPYKTKSVRLATSDYALIVTTFTSTLTTLILLLNLLK